MHYQGIEKEPFEIQETGWGEFDINIKIYPLDPTEKPVSLTLPLKLFPGDDTITLPDSTILNEREEDEIQNIRLVMSEVEKEIKILERKKEELQSELRML
ncbi:hypothetical protein O9G_000218 [Rozella allomycis CSF55]|uniref:Protein AF-9 homolog n=1 Tax=Rozella allomycis (strain CSF55) TaxID=988480 RepID=A0A075AP53_ROZAC|nr:hypothetical protein O9G_000218 [Rozella allomycis CSF55]|eukprot:EPZ31739.1 hypothetical protein O9G_000218 [Rozella allomycis CSF55]